MARTALVNAELRIGVSQLTKQWRELNGAYRDFTKKKLAFAQKVSKLWDRAKKMDESEGGTSNENYLRDELNELIQSESKSVLSKWVSIGHNASALLPYAQSLPPQRDSLYALSLASQNRKPIQRWITKGSLSSESTVRQVLTLTTGKKLSKVKSSKMMEVLRISFPEDEVIEAFAKYQNELEQFLNERGIPFSYCGIYARHETDLAKYHEKLSKLHLRLLKQNLRERIKKRIDFRYDTYYKASGRSKSKRVSLNAKLKKLGLAFEEVDVQNCFTLDELEDLYKRMELDEDGDWNMRMTEALEEAISKCAVPRSVEMFSSVSNATEDQTVEILLPALSRKKLDFTDVKVYPNEP